MTINQQRRFFFPAWATCVAAIGWRMKNGRLEMTHPDGANEHQRKVIAAAVARAAAHQRAATLDDLRHGCYVVALGRDCDTLKMNNRQVDAVTSLFKLLVNETDIAADLKLSNPDIGERERLVRKIHSLKIPDAMIDAICRKSFAPVYSAPWFEDLPLVSLRALCGILTEIKERKTLNIQHSTANPEVPPAAQPDLLAGGGSFQYPH
jgi:hypothetical protein